MLLKKIDDYNWELPKKGKMRVPGRIFANNELLNIIKQDRTLEQLKNMASIPGIQKYAIALPDAHQGYGFCIGGVAAISKEEGGVIPGGVGFDINCGVRVLKTNLNYDEIKKDLPKLLNELNNVVPNGLGHKGTLMLKQDELKDLMENGVNFLKDKGLANKNDLKNCEDNGKLKGADSRTVSKRAISRGQSALGSLGSGNHFVDIHKVSELYNEKLAKKYGLFNNQIVFTIHSGSRGFGHQIASDYINRINEEYPEEIKNLPDRELGFAPTNSQVAKDYLSSMKCAANFAFANRQLIMNNIRNVLNNFYKRDLSLDLFYDVCHNICKEETHGGVDCFVHRKGATKSFPGEKVIIPGTMGTSSFLMIGGKNSLNLTFGSTAHGSGRVMSRTRAKKEFSVRQVNALMKKRNILLKSSTEKGSTEEAPMVYKDINQIIKVSNELNIANPLAKVDPLAVLNG